MDIKEAQCSANPEASPATNDEYFRPGYSLGIECLPPPYNYHISSPDALQMGKDHDPFGDGAPPPYNTLYEAKAKVPAIQQTVSHSVVVSQPNVATAVPVANSHSDYYLTISLILTILCIVSCGYIWLICTVPALFYASKAKVSSSNGDRNKARHYGHVSLGLNIFAIVTWAIFWGIIVISASSSSSRRNYYHYYNYYYRDNYYNYYY